MKLMNRIRFVNFKKLRVVNLFLLLMIFSFGRRIIAQSIVEFTVTPSTHYTKIKPIWNAINWFYPSFALGPDGKPNMWYRETEPFVNRVTLVTATGGRVDFPQGEILKEDNSGNFYYDFNNFDKYLDATLANNYTPIIVFGAVPFVLAPKNYMVGSFGTITNPPVDYGKWHDFVKKVVEHCVNRYGSEKVLPWSWRLYTEPDNTSWWTGTKEQYFKLYDYSVDAIEKALPGAIVGPGNILGDVENHWGMQILDHAFGETNYYTGKTGTRLNFFTFSAYEQCEKEFPPMKEFQGVVDAIKEKLKKYGMDGKVALGIGEGQLMLDEDGKYLWGGDGTEYGAAWQAAYQIFGIRNGLDRIVQWEFTSDGVKTPKYNVIEMFEKMKGDTRVKMEVTKDTRDNLGKSLDKIDGIASVNGQKTSLKILIFDQHKYRDPGGLGVEDPQNVKIIVKKLPFDAAKVYVKHWLVDANHSNFFTQWLKDSKNIRRVDRSDMPGSIYDAQVVSVLDQNGRNFWYSHKSHYLEIDDLETDGPQTEQSVSNDGSFTINIKMHPHQVSLLEINKDSVETAVRMRDFNTPGNFKLSQNFPNPFGGTVEPNSSITNIRYTLSKNSFVKLIVYNVLGNVVETLVNKEQAPGIYTVTFNARNLASGIYFYQLKTEKKVITKKMIFLK